MESEIVCHCMSVTRAEIEKLILEKKAKTAVDIANLTQAGTVCGGCIPEIDKIIENLKK